MKSFSRNSKSNKKFKIECPLCRVKNVVREDQTTVYGINQDCVVCKENKVEVFLPICGHTCLCWKCINTMDYNNNSHKNILNSLIKDASDIPKNHLNLAKKLFGKRKNLYISFYDVADSVWYIRKNKNNTYQGFFVNSVCNNQYGLDIDYNDYVQRFLSGYSACTSDARSF